MNKNKIMAILICTLLSFCFVGMASAQGTVVKAEASTSQLHVGDTLTVTLKISNVQNLFGIDLTLGWNPNVITLSNVALSLGVEAHSGGVLHGNKLVYNIDNAQTGQIYVEEDRESGSYNLVATSIGESTSAFSGSGNVATLTFKVTHTGDAQITLDSELSDKATSSDPANLIVHQDNANSVSAVIPEFSIITVLALLVVVAVATMAITVGRKKLKANPTALRR
jgi:hypothetical protein